MLFVILFGLSALATLLGLVYGFWLVFKKHGAKKSLAYIAAGVAGCILLIVLAG